MSLGLCSLQTKLCNPHGLIDVKAVEEPVTEPEVTEPEVTEPEVTEPEVTEPEVTEPEVTVPEVTEPEVTEPEVTVPETKDDSQEAEPDAAGKRTRAPSHIGTLVYACTQIYLHYTH